MWWTGSVAGISALFELLSAKTLVKIKLGWQDWLIAVLIWLLEVEFVLKGSLIGQNVFGVVLSVLLASRLHYGHQIAWLTCSNVGLLVTLLNLLLLQGTGKANSLLFALMTYILVYFLFKKVANKARKLDQTISLAILLCLWLNIFILESAGILAKMTDNSALAYTLALLGHAATIGTAFVFCIKNKEHNELKKEEVNLQKYLETVKKNETELRAFKHDYQNLLRSLEMETGDQQQAVVQQLKAYSNEQFSSKKREQFKNVERIPDLKLQSLVIAKLREMTDAKIAYSLEVTKELNLPAGVDIFDLVRIVGIVLDNAIEESERLLRLGKAASIRMLFYSDQDGSFEIEVRNLTDQKRLDQDLAQKGYSSKAKHQGLGLYNIKEMEKKYPQMFASYQLEQGEFKFNVVFA